MSKTYISVLIDRSGSMGTIRGATIDGYNEFVKGQRAESGKTRWTLTLFDTVGIDTIYKNVRGREVPVLTPQVYAPRGGTPLLDAVGKTLTKGLNRARSKYYDGHVFVIMTDGYENSSSEWDNGKVEKLIAKAEKRNWQIVFLGANQDAWDSARELGIYAGSSIMYAGTDVSVAATMDSLTDAVSTYRSTNTVQADHTDTTTGKVKDRTKGETKTKTESKT